MRNWWMAVLFVGVGCGMALAQAPAPAPAPAPAKSVAVTRIFSGPDGESHAEEMRIPQNERNGGYFSTLMKGDGVVFLTRPGGAVDDWHTAGGRVQLAITVAGRAEISLGGGQKILLEPGKMILFEDKTGHGHKLTVLGSESWTAAFVPVVVEGK